MKKLIITIAALALTATASMAQVVSSRYSHRDAPAPTRQSQNTLMSKSGSSSMVGTFARVAKAQTSNNPLSSNHHSTTLRGAGNQR